MPTMKPRASHAHPPSPSDTPHRRVPGWPVRAGIIATVALAVAAPMVAAEPAAAPTRPTASVADATPARAIRSAEAVARPADRHLDEVGDIATLSGPSGSPLISAASPST